MKIFVVVPLELDIFMIILCVCVNFLPLKCKKGQTKWCNMWLMVDAFSVIYSANLLRKSYFTVANIKVRTIKSNNYLQDRKTSQRVYFVKNIKKPSLCHHHTSIIYSFTKKIPLFLIQQTTEKNEPRTNQP